MNMKMNNHDDEFNAALSDFRALLLDALPEDAAYVKIKATYEWFRDYIKSGKYETSPEAAARDFQYLLEQVGCTSMIRKEGDHFLNVVEINGDSYDIDVFSCSFPKVF